MTNTNKLYLIIFLCYLHYIFSFTNQNYIIHSLKTISSIKNVMKLHENVETKTDTNINNFASNQILNHNIEKSDIPNNDDELDFDFTKLSEESAKEAYKPKIDLSELYVKEDERKAPRQAQWLPLLLSPAALDGSYAGDVGFDPLGFSKDKESLMKYREAELKHSRLAMLAAAGWPLSELWHKSIADVIGLESILSDEGKAPSILNGGLLNSWIIGTAIGSLVLSAFLEYLTFAKVH